MSDTVSRIYNKIIDSEIYKYCESVETYYDVHLRNGDITISTNPNSKFDNYNCTLGNNGDAKLTKMPISAPESFTIFRLDKVEIDNWLLTFEIDLDRMTDAHESYKKIESTRQDRFTNGVVYYSMMIVIIVAMFYF